MVKEVAQALADVAEVADADLYLNESYRTGYGGDTSGVVCSLRTFVQCVALAMKHADDEMQDKIVQSMAGLRQDPMGSNTIFY